MQHNIRKHFKLSMEEYAVLDAICCLSNTKPCDKNADYFVDLFDISRRTYFNIKKSLSDKNLIVTVENGIKTTSLWNEAVQKKVKK